MLNIKSESTHQQAKAASVLKPLTNSHNEYVNLKLYNRDSDLLAIHEAAKLVSRALNPDFTITSLLRMMSQMLGLNRGRVLLPQDDKLRIRFSYGLTPEEQQRGCYASGEGITGKVMLANQLVVIENIDEEPELLFKAVDRKTLPQEVVSYIALPIMDGTCPIGVLACHRIRSRMRPFDADLVILRTFATLIGQIVKIHKLNEQSEELDSSPINTSAKQLIIGESEEIQSTIDQIEQVSKTDVTVLLSGESGTGKECFARLLHCSSPRANKPFIAINCAAIPEQLLEAELFGHERGAFTGAVAKKFGKFEAADGGTLFLDEIGDLDAALQTKLLRVLETKSIQRVGGTAEIPVNIRIVVATHKNLMQQVNDGEFRLDLFYRLNVFPIVLPALRERIGDVSILTRFFLKKAKREFKKHAILEQGVLERLNNYEWPGNIRQLENVVKRALLLSKDNKIGPSLIDNILAAESQVTLFEDLENKKNHQTSNKAHQRKRESIYPNTEHSSHRTDQKRSSVISSSSHLTESTTNERRPYGWISTDEVDEITRALREAKGNKTRAAAALGMSARQFRYRMTKLNIPDPRK